MDISGEERIDAPREAVWAALNDPDILKACIAGCQSLIRTSPTTLEATVKIRIGIISATIKGDLTLSNLKPPESYTIWGEGKGGIAGFARGGADVRLAEDGATTILSYAIRGQVGGKLAQLGTRLVSSWANKLAARFFTDLGAKLNDGAA